MYEIYIVIDLWFLFKKININSIIWLERKENEIVVGFLNKSFLM